MQMLILFFAVVTFSNLSFANPGSGNPSVCFAAGTFIHTGHDCPEGTVKLKERDCGQQHTYEYCFKCVKKTTPQSPSLLEDCSTTPYQASTQCPDSEEEQLWAACPQERY